MINMAFMPLYMWEMWDVTPVTNGRTHEQWKVEQYSVWAESAIFTGDSFLFTFWRKAIAYKHICSHCLFCPNQGYPTRQNLLKIAIVKVKIIFLRLEDLHCQTCLDWQIIADREEGAPYGKQHGEMGWVCFQRPESQYFLKRPTKKSWTWCLSRLWVSSQHSFDQKDLKLLRWLTGLANYLLVSPPPRLSLCCHLVIWQWHLFSHSVSTLR